MKKCIHCGAQLPDKSNFCPYCRRKQVVENEKTGRLRPWGKLLLIGAIVAVALLSWGIASLVSALRYTPVTVNSQSAAAEYTDRSGSYLLSLRWETGEAAQELSRVLSAGQEGEATSLLYAFDAASGEDRRAAFLRRMESVEVEAIPSGNGEAMTLGTPGPDGGSVRGVEVKYTTACGTNQIRWTIRMKNGDTITLRHSLRTVQQRSRSYSYRDHDLTTLDKLQAFLEDIQGGSYSDTVTTIYLPPVEYEGGLRLDTRAYIFIGSTEGEQRTTFTDTVYVDVRTPQIAEFSGISFRGTGGIGLSAQESAILRDCSFEGWDIGVDSRDGSWVGAYNCDFIANGVGYRFNSGKTSLSSPTYSGDRFIGNGIGFQILKTPSRVVLSFPGCWFERNSTDIDNTIYQGVNTKGATFVKGD